MKKTLSKVLLMALLIISFTMAAQAQETLWKELIAKSETLYQQGRYSEAAQVDEKALKVAEKVINETMVYDGKTQTVEINL